MTLIYMKLIYFIFKKIIHKRAVEDRALKYWASWSTQKLEKAFVFTSEAEEHGSTISKLNEL